MGVGAGSAVAFGEAEVIGVGASVAVGVTGARVDGCDAAGPQATTRRANTPTQRAFMEEPGNDPIVITYCIIKITGVGRVRWCRNGPQHMI